VIAVVKHVDKIGTQVLYFCKFNQERIYMGRIVITLTDEMHEALKEVAKEKSNSVSGITRLALYEWLKTNGRVVEDWYVEWGGDRNKNG
jgi:hypothetical protein